MIVLRLSHLSLCTLLAQDTDCHFFHLCSTNVRPQNPWRKGRSGARRAIDLVSNYLTMNSPVFDGSEAGI